MASVVSAPSGSRPEDQGSSSQGPENNSSSLTRAVRKTDYIRTAAQNYISRSANILGAPNLSTKGKSIIQADTTIHGDFGAPIHIGRYCYIEEGVVMILSVVPISSDPLLAIDRPSSGYYETPPGKNEKALPIIIGSHTQIGSNTRIQSVTIGSCVRIGSNCTLSPRSKVHDCCIIEDNTLIPPDMVVPPFSRVRGSPGKIIGTLPECCGGEFVEGCVQDYLHFVRRLED
eukprot:CAMPEP_0172298622 /NCGR_PEP_ID=MMETSP1058-20130122/1193_1 /TAXON_ID=83371 /ORGANISM="Detonula confervacea, Strain CCMP 353" /LENGTH=229 /DNA_ID=CAMNT_0013007903 /DNA_START=21 /DNA_END=710 /DNA_ORIENTATION=+